MKSLLKRLYSLALHPSASKRLGAALAFNHIYTIFRQVYMIECFHQCSVTDEKNTFCNCNIKY